jgi:ABC-type dipeptide/oligopeptide/nickel transport system permease component
MGPYILRRIGYSVFVLWGALTVVFVAVRLVPGDPAQMMLGSQATDEEVAALTRDMGLDQSMVVQYGRFMQQAVRLDFGESLRLQVDAVDAVTQRLPATSLLAVTAMAFAILISLPLGMAAALRQYSIIDRFVSVLSLLGQSVPGFWLGIMFILVFARWLQWLPSSGTGGPQHLILPALTLALPLVGILTRLIRTGLLEVLNEDYVRTAYAKGLTARIVILRHALRNALIPVVTVAALQFGSLLAGTVIIETVFGWPGAGRLLVDAISNRDYAIIQTAILFITTGFVTLNLLVDVSYAYLDPRIRYG